MLPARSGSPSIVRVVMSMIDWAEGREKKARTGLLEAEKFIETHWSPRTSIRNLERVHHWLAADILHREAVELLGTDNSMAGMAQEPDDSDSESRP